MDFFKWLYPGMHIKRWLLLLLVGIIGIGLGLAYILREVYEFYTFPDFIFYVTLQFIPRYLRGGIFLSVSAALIIIAVWRFNHSLISALVPDGRDDSLVNIVYQQRNLKRGLKVVAIGGGTGLSTLLRGLKESTGNLTAIVTVADDGGSSGRLRRELGVLPPGDFRNCIVAMADAEPLMTRLFQYRFGEGSGLEGHSFGNLFIVAMSGITGSFEEAIKESSRVLAVRGRILPSTLANVTLYAQMEDEATIQGESNIPHGSSPIKRVFLEPSKVTAYPEAMQASLEADLIVIGPGSLYTSILPNLLVDGIKEAIWASPALKVYVCNVATQRGETDGFSVAEHVAAIERHVGPGLFHYVLANSNTQAHFPAEWKVDAVSYRGEALNGVEIVLADVVNPENRLRHDPKRLAGQLLRLYNDRGKQSSWAGGRIASTHEAGDVIETLVGTKQE